MASEWTLQNYHLSKEAKTQRNREGRDTVSKSNVSCPVAYPEQHHQVAVVACKGRPLVRSPCNVVIKVVIIAWVRYDRKWLFIFTGHVAMCKVVKGTEQ